VGSSRGAALHQVSLSTIMKAKCILNVLLKRLQCEESDAACDPSTIPWTALKSPPLDSIVLVLLHPWLRFVALVCLSCSSCCAGGYFRALLISDSVRL
jgi:hypothetical protein